jgi:hypothetical protein
MRGQKKTPAIAPAGASVTKELYDRGQTSPVAWRVQSLALRFGLSLETAATVAALALAGGGYG